MEKKKWFSKLVLKKMEVEIVRGFCNGYITSLIIKKKINL
jgi:hypothetical protein